MLKKDLSCLNSVDLVNLGISEAASAGKEPRRPRFQDTGKSSFFGDFVYQHIIPQDHFLVALNNLFDWGALSGELLQAYRRKGVRGRPLYDPVQMFKILFIS